MIPFYRVVDTNDFSVHDFSVNMSLELEPAGISTGMLSSEWELVEAIPQMSGSLVEGAGLTAQFLNPKRGGVYRFRGISGFGAVATLYGVPVRMAKLGNFLAGYGTKRLGVWGVSRWLSQSIGSDNDATADMSWAAGGDVADGSNVVATVSSLSTNMWFEADDKVKTLWPNPATTDNHLTHPVGIDYNWFFRSPRVIEEAAP